jgi:hypothetical protein
MSKTFEVKINSNRFKAYTNKSRKVYQQALDDVLDDLVRTSSESAPHEEGILEKSWSKETKFKGSKPFGVVSYSVKKKSGKGNFNYALKMHEENYNLGVGSRLKSGGTGMSGRTYKVGTGYLGDVLKGEEKAYKNHIQSELRKFSKKF